MTLGMIMKWISKQQQPTELQKWKETNRNIKENLVYGKGGFPTESVLNRLISEQGGICAYTLIKISSSTSHIEHLKPQTICKKEDEKKNKLGKPELREDIKWLNLVACFPQPNSHHPGYGALQKDDWWSDTNFISPLSTTCESRFKYTKDGNVEPCIPSDTTVKETINKLKLDTDSLKELRKIAIFNHGLHIRSKNPIQSISKVDILIQQLKQKNKGNSNQFCTPLIQVAEDYKNIIKKISDRKKKLATKK